MKKTLVLLVVSMMALSGVGFLMGYASSDHSGNHSAIQEAASLLFGTSTEYSSNWAGYALTGTGFTSVTGSFIVPSLPSGSTSGSTGGHGHGNGKGNPNGQGIIQTNVQQKPNNGHGGGSGTTTYAAFWAGIDGFSSNTVEQAGVLMNVTNGVATYSAWTEFYPAYPTYSHSFTPQAGDTIVVSITVSGSTGSQTVTAIVTDTSQGHSYTSTVSGKSYSLSSAEWIAEAPSSISGVLPLADFGTVNFGSQYTGISGTNYAVTSGGSSQPIGDFATIIQLDMVSPTTLKATTSSLSNDGASFTVTWDSS